MRQKPKVPVHMMLDLMVSLSLDSVIAVPECVTTTNINGDVMQPKAAYESWFRRGDDWNRRTRIAI